MLQLEQEYQQTCQDLRSLTHKSEEGIYFFKYFEQKYDIIPNDKIQSTYFMKFKDTEQYVLVGYGCKSDLFQWIPASNRFERMKTIVTGHLQKVLSFKSDVGTFVALAKTPTDKCPLKGLHVFSMTGDGDALLSKSFDSQLKVYDIHPSLNTDQSFYALIDNSRVIEFDIDLNELEEWLLPETVSQYRFLPNEINKGLALSDGRIMVVLSSMRQSSNRFIRNIDLEDSGFEDHQRAFNFNDYSDTIDLKDGEESNDGVEEIAVATPSHAVFEFNEIKMTSDEEPMRGDTSLNEKQDFDQYDATVVIDESVPKLSEILRKEAALDMEKPTITPTTDYDFLDADKSPAEKYRHNPSDVVRLNIEEKNPQLQSKDETDFTNRFRDAAAQINSKIQVLKDMIVPIPENTDTINSTIAPGIAIISNEEIPFAIARIGREDSNDDPENQTEVRIIETSISILLSFLIVTIFLITFIFIYTLT